MRKMNDEQRYLFDLQGYLVLKNVIPQETIQQLNAVMDRLEQTSPEDLPPGVSHGKARTEQELYVSNIVEADPIFHQFIDFEPILPIIHETSLGLYRLNHCYGIYRWGYGFTYIHMHNRPMHPKATYHCQNGEILSLTTKVAYPIRNHNVEDGCFAVIPGSHKANFLRPYSNHPDANPPLVAVDAQPGDAVVFTEALSHGSMVNTSGRNRRTIYFCYSVGYMPDWTKFGLTFSPGFADKLSPRQREILRRKDG